MGLFSSIGSLFGGKPKTSKKSQYEQMYADALRQEEEDEATRMRKEADDLLAEQKKKRNEKNVRSKVMHGGGREGLMFMGNQTGVSA